MTRLVYSLLTTALVQAANLGFGVAAARLLGPNDRGIFAYQVTLSTVVATLFSFGIGEAIAYVASANRAGFRHSTYIVASVLYGAAGALAWLFVYPMIATISNHDQYLAYAVFMAYPVLNYLTLCLVAWFAGRGLTRAWNIQRVLVQISQPLTLVCLLVIEGASISAFAFSVIFAHIIAVAVGVCQISVSSFLAKPRWLDMKEVFQVGMQSFGSRLSDLIRDNADRLIVGTLLAPEILAQYVVAVSVAQIFNAYSQTVIQLYFPRIGALVNSGHHALIERQAAFLVLGGGIAAIAVSFLASDWLVVAIFGGKFAMAGELAPVLVVGMVFASMKALISAHALAIRQPWITSKIDVYAVPVTIATIFLAVHLVGAWGAACAFVFSQAGVAYVMFLAYRQFRTAR
ncbi:oligosaccharide flippase family protein [Bradyrhizobium sp. TM233]|uniref:oligosaccharide flippase family protein n=1 Tax=Bradyrhizobium sp. TM233 TaxID=2599801 RepID=UPI0030C6727D